MVLRNPASGGTGEMPPEGLKLNPHLKWGLLTLILYPGAVCLMYADQAVLYPGFVRLINVSQAVFMCVSSITRGG